MICNGIWACQTPCKGIIRGYKFDAWPAPVTLCKKHLAEVTKDSYVIKGELPSKQLSRKEQ